MHVHRLQMRIAKAIKDKHYYVELATYSRIESDSLELQELVIESCISH